MQKQAGEFGIVARTKGGPEVLEWAELDSAAPGPGSAFPAAKAV